jgi:hypothetical protein
VGYTNLGGSDSQFYPAPPEAVWAAVRHYLDERGVHRFRSIDDDLMRVETNLGMTAFTGSCIATISVQSTEGGSTVRFDGRMGVFSQGQFGASKRIEDERTLLFRSVAAFWPDYADDEVTGALTAPAASTDDIAAQLARLADLHREGALNDSEFAAAKAKILH